MIVALLGDTVNPVIAAGKADTITVAVPFTPSTVAVIVALPTATAVTSPVELTVATAGFAEDQLTERPVNVAPDASRADAVRDCVPPTDKPSAGGDTSTAATDTAVTVTVTIAVSVAAAYPEAAGAVAVTVIIAVPAATAVMTPELDTVATLGAVVPYVTAAAGAPGGCVTVSVSP